MLYAELQGKVGPDAPEAERDEDVLTSTVFGTLLIAGALAHDAIANWLARARSLAGERAPIRSEIGTHALEFWFWPRLREAEPDVILQIGSLLVVVEAKYLSGKSSSASAPGNDDQLARQWRSSAPDAVVSGVDERLNHAIATCGERVLIYLVRRTRWRHALAEVAASASIVPDARLYLLAWEDLDEVLESVPDRWSRDLRAYLRRRGLAVYRGFRRLGGMAGARPLAGWRAELPHRGGWPRTFPRERVQLLARLHAQRLLRGGVAGVPETGAAGGWATAFSPHRLRHLASLHARFSLSNNGGRRG